LDEFIQRIVAMGGTPLEMLEDDEVLDLLLPCRRADFELVETWQYREEPPLALPIVAHGGVDDPFVSREALKGWRQHTTAALHSHRLPENHFYSSSDEPALLNLLSRQSLEP
jgi:surfactin synthase thioesterase subunit